jgi:hypothetical protein
MLVLDPDNSRFYHTRTRAIWDLNTQTKVRELESFGHIATFSNDGDVLHFADLKKTGFLDLRTNKPVISKPKKGDVKEFSPNGSMYYRIYDIDLDSNIGELRIYDTASDRRIHTIHSTKFVKKHGLDDCEYLFRTPTLSNNGVLLGGDGCASMWIPISSGGAGPPTKLVPNSNVDAMATCIDTVTENLYVHNIDRVYGYKPDGSGVPTTSRAAALKSYDVIMDASDGWLTAVLNHNHVVVCRSPLDGVSTVNTYRYRDHGDKCDFILSAHVMPCALLTFSSYHGKECVHVDGLQTESDVFVSDSRSTFKLE